MTALGLWGSLEQEIHRKPSPQADGDGDLWGRLAGMVDTAEFRPRMAADVELKEFHLKWGNDYAMLANPRDLLHYRLTPEEAELVKLMDGTRTVKEIVLDRFQESGDLGLTGVVELVRQLHSDNFLDRRYTNTDTIVSRALDPVSVRRAKAREFAKTLSIEWKGADRFVRWLYNRLFKVFFNRMVLVVTTVMALGGVAFFVGVVRRHQFTLTGHSLAIGFLALLILEYLMVFIHELGHALVLVHHRRKIKAAGFMIYFGSPSFFIEASDGLMLDREARMAQAFAGPYGQLIIASIASGIAFVFPNWVLSETLYRYAVLNYLTVFMNLVPLLELDGYYILADLIQVPDLRPRSLQFFHHDLWHGLRSRRRLTKQEVGLTLYAVLGFLFTVASFYTAYFYWKTVFGGLIIRLWQGGLITQILLVALAMLVAGPLVRGGINFLRALLRRIKALGQRVRFRFEQKWRVEAAEMIDALPLFDDVPVEILNELAGRVKLRTFSRGQPVVRQGDRAESFYVIRRGTLQVVEENPQTGGERPLRLLGKGDSFGELALIQGAPRSVTVRALDEAELFEVDKGTFDQLLADMVHVPEFAPSLQAVAELRELPPFAHLESDELLELLERGEWILVRPGGHIVEQGQVGDAFYAVRSGQVDVTENGELVRTLGPGSHFGEIALLLDVPRTATVTARTPVRAYRLDRVGFDRLVRDAFRKGMLNPYISQDRTWQH